MAAISSRNFCLSNSRGSAPVSERRQLWPAPAGRTCAPRSITKTCSISAGAVNTAEACSLNVAKFGTKTARGVTTFLEVVMVPPQNSCRWHYDAYLWHYCRSSFKVRGATDKDIKWDL